MNERVRESTHRYEVGRLIATKGLLLSLFGLHEARQASLEKDNSVWNMLIQKCYREPAIFSAFSPIAAHTAERWSVSCRREFALYRSF